SPRNLLPATIPVDAVSRQFFYVPGPTASSPLLVVLHGAGGTAPGMAALTGLATRGPMAGFAVAFPEGWNHRWNGDRERAALAARRGSDDVAFVQAVIRHLAPTSVADPDRVCLAGISNGAFLAEHIARRGFVAVQGIAWVAGSATARSRAGFERPAQSCAT